MQTVILCWFGGAIGEGERMRMLYWVRVVPGKGENAFLGDLPMKEFAGAFHRSDKSTFLKVSLLQAHF
jgi:hypothetical protein